MSFNKVFVLMYLTSSQFEFFFPFLWGVKLQNVNNINTNEIELSLY